MIKSYLREITARVLELAAQRFENDITPVMELLIEKTVRQVVKETTDAR